MNDILFGHDFLASVPVMPVHLTVKNIPGHPGAVHKTLLHVPLPVDHTYSTFDHDVLAKEIAERYKDTPSTYDSFAGDGYFLNEPLYKELTAKFLTAHRNKAAGDELHGIDVEVQFKVSDALPALPPAALTSGNLRSHLRGEPAANIVRQAPVRQAPAVAAAPVVRRIRIAELNPNMPLYDWELVVSIKALNFGGALSIDLVQPEHSRLDIVRGVTWNDERKTMLRNCGEGSEILIKHAHVTDSARYGLQVKIENQCKVELLRSKVENAENFKLLRPPPPPSASAEIRTFGGVSSLTMSALASSSSRPSATPAPGTKAWTTKTPFVPKSKSSTAPPRQVPSEASRHVPEASRGHAPCPETQNDIKTRDRHNNETAAADEIEDDRRRRKRAPDDNTCLLCKVNLDCVVSIRALFARLLKLKRRVNNRITDDEFLPDIPTMLSTLCEQRDGWEPRLMTHHVFVEPNVTRKLWRAHVRCVHICETYQQENDIFGAFMLQAHCCGCGEEGATVKCYHPTCDEWFHSSCALFSRGWVDFGEHDPVNPVAACPRHAGVHTAPALPEKRKTKRRQETQEDDDVVFDSRVALDDLRDPDEARCRL
jgi:hypothetical protein